MAFLTVGSYCFIVWISFVIVPVYCEQNPVVSVTQGKIMGRIDYSRNHRKFVSFLGIPYAKPPNRFEVAQPPEMWNGTRDGRYYRDICIQLEPATSEIIGSEDCLYFNVFMPTFDAPSRTLLPVLVFIGGDNWQTSGPADMYGPQYIMDEDVVLVTFNYRLGAFGFLSTGNGNIPANLGLKDQVMLLKWIQGNIHVFGGDRMRVTLFGSGSGSVAVSLHLLSGISEGLFANGISQSGTFSCPNAIVMDPESVASQLSSLLKCPKNVLTPYFRMCLVGKNASEILQAQNELTGWEKSKLSTPFGPTVEIIPDELSNHASGIRKHQLRSNYLNFEQNSFLTDYPENVILRKGGSKKVPWIVGVNSKAGFSRSVAALRQNDSFLEALNSNWLKLAPLLFQYSLSAKSPTYISLKVKEFYFFNENIDNQNLNQLYNALSDHNYFQCTKRSAILYGKVAPVYLYYFTYERVNHLRMPEINGVPDGSELQYFFKINSAEFLEIAQRSRSFKFSKSLIRLWASFANFGLPKATWPTFNNWQPLPESEMQGDSPLHWYFIDTETKSATVPFMARVSFWEKLNTTYKLESMMEAYRKQRERRLLDILSSAHKLSAFGKVSSDSYSVIALLSPLLLFRFVLV